MIDDRPVALVEPRLKTQVADPGGCFARLPLPPGVVMIRFERHVDVEQLARQPLQKHARDQPIQIAFMGEDYVRFGQYLHALTIAENDRPVTEFASFKSTDADSNKG